ncbi:tripartite tricarboxylate transporter TctB family protein [Cryobacterium glaciale]|uniref:Tripartite tricarboxylate transporter TctB family protein n=1 Tax=Cryobacterium glaciale TaxID=1259145 RepID=A0A4R8V2A9_9MICO|nr:tripartite tricarboxylate transporter TctB family protein [Cryobacterium glaciale]TFB75020.1 tripartite tricarboxylate transporter TctB family protein [Cryobacterium glaciale]
MSTEVISAIRAAPGRWARVNKSDLIITALLLVVFLAAMTMATEWKPLAAYFPLGVSALGAAASATFLVRVLFFPRSAEAPKTNIPEEARSMADQEYEFFRSLTTRDWIVAVAWLGGFYVALAVAGIYVAMAVFTVAYLKLQASRSWFFAIVYAALLAGITFLIFSTLLKLPLPGGLLGLT